MLRQERMKHTDFYNLLDQVNDRIVMYKSLFLDKRPKYIKDTLAQRASTIEFHEYKLKKAQDERKSKILA